jgi:hypothetical protein
MSPPEFEQAPPEYKPEAYRYKDAEGSGGGLFEGTAEAFAWRSCGMQHAPSVTKISFVGQCHEYI